MIKETDAAFQLDELVKKFKRWASENFPDVTEENDNGEWVFCDEFDEMIKFSLKFLENVNAENTTPETIDNLLFCIARDSECSNLITHLEHYDKWFSLLCRASFKTNYINAKWQFAEHLPNYRGNDNLQEVVFDFLEVNDEYTQRMALQSLAILYPKKAENYAIKHWEKAKEFDKIEEYHKMMALDVLYKIQSSKLKQYLALAQKSKYQYLKLYADKLIKNEQNN